MEMSLFEMESSAPVSYSVDTVIHYRKLFPNSKIYFLMGFDQLDRLDEWHDVKTLAKNAQIVAYARPGFPKNHELVKKYNVKVIEYSDLVDLSSTDIRTLKNLMTKKEVIDYIIKNDLYFSKTVQGYYDDKRYKHAVSVAELAYDIAQSNHIEPTKAYLAGYLHDVAKLMAHDEDAKRMMNKFFPRFKDFPHWAWHQFLGSMVAHYYFGIKERSVTDAIKYHTTGCGNMNRYAKIVYCADKLDPLRGWDSEALIEMCKQDLETGFIAELKHNTEYIDEHNPDERKDFLTQACISKYLG